MDTTGPSGHVLDRRAAGASVYGWGESFEWCQSVRSSRTVTTDPAEILVAALCLVSLVLAGGFTQGVVPEDGDVEFVVERQSICPEDRIVRGCVPPNASGDVWQLQLIDPFLEDLVTLVGTTPPGDATGSSDGTSSPASPAEATDAAAAGVGTSPTPAAGARADSAGGLGLASGLDWLRWPLGAAVGLALVAGLVLALRRGSIESPRDLFGLPGAVRTVLLAVLVGSAGRVAALLRAQVATLLAVLRRASWRGASPPTPAVRPLDTIHRLLLGLAGLPAAAIGRLLGRSATDEVVSSAGGDATAPRAPDPDDFDIRLAWAWLARRTARRAVGSRTPEEIAADAVDRGYPAEAVGELLGAFRDVTYGGYPPTGERLATARRAFEAVRTVHRTSTGGED